MTSMLAGVQLIGSLIWLFVVPPGKSVHKYGYFFCAPHLLVLLLSYFHLKFTSLLLVIKFTCYVDESLMYAHKVREYCRPTVIGLSHFDIFLRES